MKSFLKLLAIPLVLELANVIVHHGVLKEGVEFLPKPYSLERLARRVREVLDKPQP